MPPFVTNDIYIHAFTTAQLSISQWMYYSRLSLFITYIICPLYPSGAQGDADDYDYNYYYDDAGPPPGANRVAPQPKPPPMQIRPLTDGGGPGMQKIPHIQKS